MSIANSSIKPCTRARYRQDGAAAIEMGLVLIFLVMIVGGLIEFGRVFWYYDALTKAVRDGARLMSLADKATINSVGMVGAETIVVNAANAARVTPALTAANVLVECLDDSYQPVTCVDGTAPLNVRVGIVDFSVVIGDWFPMLLPTGGATTYSRQLLPQTTMRYMR